MSGPWLSQITSSSALASTVKSLRQGFAQLTKQPFRQVMASPPTITAAVATSMGAGYQHYPFGYSSAAAVFSPTCFHPSSLSANATDQCLSADNVTTNAAGTTFGGNTFRYSFIHTGRYFELQMQSGAARTFLVKIDGQYVSLTPTTDAVNNFFQYDCGTSDRRRIDVIGFATNSVALALNGVNIDATDSIFKAPVRGPKTILMSDSFGANNNGFPYAFAEFLGWDDVWGSGVGGTGYTVDNGGVATTFAGRVQHDVIQYNPGVVGIIGSVNDDSSSYNAIYAAAYSLYTTLKAALPNALIFASPSASKGVDGYTTGMLNNKLAKKNAAAAAGIYWVDICEQPMSRTPLSGLVKFTSNSGAAVVYLDQAWDGALSVGLTGATISLNNDQERHLILSTQINSGFTQANLMGNLLNTQAVGNTWSVIGPSYLTGLGKVGATTGAGNCDLYVSNDGIHPSADGQIEKGKALASTLINVVTA